MHARVLVLAVSFLAGGCAFNLPGNTPEGPPPPVLVPPPASVAAADAPLPRYRCDQGIEFTVQFGDGTAVVDAGGRGNEILLRDAGGLTPQQTVYSNTKMKVELGLEPAGRGARLNFLSPALAARCVRD